MICRRIQLVDKLTDAEKLLIEGTNNDGSFVYKGNEQEWHCPECNFKAPGSFHICPKCSSLFE
jgi:rubrerythrin